MLLGVLPCLGTPLLYHFLDAPPHPSTTMFCLNRPTVLGPNNLDHLKPLKRHLGLWSQQ